MSVEELERAIDDCKNAVDELFQMTVAPMRRLALWHLMAEMAKDVESELQRHASQVHDPAKQTMIRTHCIETVYGKDLSLFESDVQACQTLQKLSCKNPSQEWTDEELLLKDVQRCLSKEGAECFHRLFRLLKILKRTVHIPTVFPRMFD